MRFRTAKKGADVVLAGIKAELDIVDGTTHGITLSDGQGHVVHITQRGYNLFVEVPAPPATEKKYKLHGHVLDVPVERLFDEEFEANQEKRRLEDETARHELKVEHVDVEVQE
ncbi:MAG: hypothetical protein ACRETH_05480 [Steroidobacteraceae bacterium]